MNFIVELRGEEKSAEFYEYENCVLAAEHYTVYIGVVSGCARWALHVSRQREEIQYK